VTQPTTTYTCYLAESDPQGRREWLAALDTIESLHPQTVIAGHQRAGRHDGPEIIEETRQYIRDFDRIADTAATARDLYDQVLALYPERNQPERAVDLGKCGEAIATPECSEPTLERLDTLASLVDTRAAR